MPAGYLRFEAMMLRADLLLSDDELPPEPRQNDASIWKRYVAALKKKKNDITMRVIEKRKECQKIRKTLHGHLPLAEPRLPLMPLWVEYEEKLKREQRKIMEAKRKGLDLKKKLGPAADQLLVEPQALDLRKWQSYVRAAEKITNNVIPIRETALKLRDEMQDGSAPVPPDVWEKSLWREYIQTLKRWRKEAGSFQKDAEKNAERLQGNPGLPTPPTSPNRNEWEAYREKLQEIQKQIDETKEEASKLRSEFKGTPDIPADEEGNESNIQSAWLDYIKGLQKLVDQIERKRKEAQFIITKFVEELGIPEVDMPTEPPRPYSIEDWEEHIKKLANMEAELEELKVKAKELRADPCFKENQDILEENPFPKIDSPAKWGAVVSALSEAKGKVDTVREEGEKLVKLMAEGNDIGSAPSGSNIAEWEKYIITLKALKSTVEKMFPYAESLRDHGEDTSLEGEIKKLKPPKNMSAASWATHIVDLEDANPRKKHKNVDRDAKVPVGLKCKVTGFHPYKFPLHNGFGEVTKVILIDPCTIGYEVMLDEGRWLNAQTNKFVEEPIAVQDQNIVPLPNPVEGELAKYREDMKKHRAGLMAQHTKQQKSAANVKKIQDQIRQCTGQDGKEKRLRAKRTKMADVGVKAGKKKTVYLKKLEKLESLIMEAIKDTTSTWVYLNGIMQARTVKQIVEWIGDLGFKIKSHKQIGPCKLGYEMGFKIEMVSQGERKKFAGLKTIGKGGKIDCGPHAGTVVNMEGNPLKIHFKPPD